MASTIDNRPHPKDIDPSQLPRDWRNYPAPFELARIGTEWALSLESLLLRVPSAVIQHEFNILINPMHPDLRSVTVIEREPFRYDERLQKNNR